MSNHPSKTPCRGGRAGSAIIAVLGLIALLTLLLVSLLQSVRMERSSSASNFAAEQAYLSAESAIASASALLITATSNRPAYLIGLTNNQEEAAHGDLAPALMIGATNLSSKNQMLPLFSFDLKRASLFPRMTNGTLESLLDERLSTNSSVAVDLNDPSLVASFTQTNGTNSPILKTPGMISIEGRYPALWQSLHDDDGTIVGRYAFILTDESSKLNPALHHGNPRTDATNWDNGPGDIPLTNGTTELPDAHEAAELRHVAEILPTAGSYETAFSSEEDYQRMRPLLTHDPCRTPDLIPATLPEGGLPKYNLNDLATNPAWGTTSYDRATNLARIIDKNLPKFKQRDPSLAGKGNDPFLYLTRLACCIVDYISPTQGPTGPPGGEPSGRDLVPYVTQIAEKCTRTAYDTNASPNTTTVESQFFVEVWNPTTSTIPSGSPRLLIGNRARLNFGDGLKTPFRNYDEVLPSTPALKPNEFAVYAFNPETQTWTSPIQATSPPSWIQGPTGNAIDEHQNFEFYWNGKLVDMSRRPPRSPGNEYGGLTHYKDTLGDSLPHWQCFTIPTWSAGKDQRPIPDESGSAINTNNYRFVADPRANFLTSYNWGTQINYPINTLWKGIKPAGQGLWSLMDPYWTWTSRDYIPVNPPAGSLPASSNQNPDQIPSPYNLNRDSITAPFVMRKGPMKSLVELGNVFDPAQIDDNGQPSTNNYRFCNGGARTLRIGQPEFTFSGTYNWNTPGKRAIELLDLFTLADQGRHAPSSATIPSETNSGVPGRINVNTASHAVLTTLFYGIGVTSDQRSTNSRIGANAADDLASVIEKNRPYQKLSDLYPLTTNFVNAQTYTPVLFGNVRNSFPPVADAFDRAREEAFGKFIGHCALQTRLFHLYAIGEALDRHGKTIGRAIVEGLLRLEPDHQGRLIPHFHDVQWH